LKFSTKRYSVKLELWNRNPFHKDGRLYEQRQYGTGFSLFLDLGVTTEEQAKEAAQIEWKQYPTEDWIKRILIRNPESELIYEHFTNT